MHYLTDEQAEEMLEEWDKLQERNRPHKSKKYKHKKKCEVEHLQKELDKVKGICVELKRENMILRNKVKRLEHEDKMNQPRRKKYPPFWGAPWYCWGSDAWR